MADPGIGSGGGHRCGCGAKQEAEPPRGGCGRGAPFRPARGSGGALEVPPAGSGAEPQKPTLALDKKLGLLRLNTMRKLVANMKH